MKGGWPSTEDADDCKHRKPQALFEGDGATQGTLCAGLDGNLRREMEAVDRRHSDHRNEQQDLDDEQAAIGGPEQCAEAADEQEGVDGAGQRDERDGRVSHMREIPKSKRDQGDLVGQSPRPPKKPSQWHQPTEPQPGCEQMSGLIELMTGPRRALLHCGVADPAETGKQSERKDQDNGAPWLSIATGQG